jgi:hypothetical protein
VLAGGGVLRLRGLSLREGRFAQEDNIRAGSDDIISSLILNVIHQHLKIVCGAL